MESTSKPYVVKLSGASGHSYGYTVVWPATKKQSSPSVDRQHQQRCIHKPFRGPYPGIDRPGDVYLDRLSYARNQFAGKTSRWPDNQHADKLSRRASPYEWMLHPQLFRYLDNVWGPHSIDRFASMTSTQLPNYNSLWFDPLTGGVDALSQTDWADHNN